MNRKYLLAVATILGTLWTHNLARCETFLAIGLPDGNPRNGWVYGSAGTESQALNLCRGLETATNKNNGILNIPPNASQAQRACKIVGHLVDECYSIASNGTATTSASAIGWMISTDEDLAKSEAIARCNAMRSRNATPCIVRNTYCDATK